MTVPTQQLAPADLITTSIRTIQQGQSASGAYIASPTFEQYAYGWLRDGAYCAIAMDVVGHSSSSADFHQWVISVLHRHEEHITALSQLAANDESIDEGLLLPTRFHLNGRTELEHGANEWPNFQLDGYGTWLFAFREHIIHRDTPLSLREAGAVRLAAEYLASTWQLPCYDYWEEYGERRHTSTLASIAAGLRAASEMLNEKSWELKAQRVFRDIEELCTDGERFTKGPDDSRVDASLLSMATPFDLVALDDPRMVATVRAIDEQLSTPSGGVRRYVGDEYYGGSPWLLLTAWRGWHARRQGDANAHARARDWVRMSAGHDGLMPEQRVDEPQLPDMVAAWEARWGTAADPLLWSHAKYLLMETESELDGRAVVEQ